MKPASASFPTLLLLCGGKSSRMDPHNKALLPYKGKPWIEEQLDRFEKTTRAGSIVSVRVILGYGADTVLESLPWLKAEAPHPHGRLHVQAVINQCPQFGPFSSIQAGARGLGRDAFVLPIDVPGPSPAVWSSLYAALKAGALAAVPLHHGKGGHPVALSARFLKTLESIPPESPDARLDKQLHVLPLKELARIEVDDPSVLLDLDRPKDWKAFNP